MPDYNTHRGAHETEQDRVGGNRSEKKKKKKKKKRKNKRPEKNK